MPRLDPVEPPYPPEVADDFARLMPPGMEPLLLFRTIAHNPRVLSRIRRGGLLDRGAIEPRDREIIILRTCARCGSEYEWGVHVAAFAAAVGLSEPQIRATVLGGPDDSEWSPRDRLLVRLADELHDSARVSDTLWEALGRHWGSAGVVELLVLAGLYHAISFVTNGLAIEREPFAEKFPAARNGPEPQ